MALAPGDKLGPFEIIARIGAGGMGEVYRARDTNLDRNVALKVLPSALAHDSERLARFEREAKVLAALNHPNIAQIYGVEQGALVMELVEGLTLAERLSAGAIPATEAVEIATSLAEALETAHSKGVIHRDLKPANIKLPGDGRVKVLDFGLAKRLEHTSEADETLAMGGETGAGQIIGTISYMSPEQAEGRNVGERSDIFSFGVVLYEMLCGARPFCGQTTVATLASILRDKPIPPSQLRPQIPVSLERIVLQCLAKKPQDRCSASELRGELQLFQKTVTRRIKVPKQLAIAATLILLIGLAAVGARWYTQTSRVRWAQTIALPEASRLMEQNHILAALKLARQAEAYVPNAPELVSLKEHLAPSSIETTPPGTDIYVIDYADSRAGDLKQWEHLGRSPVKTPPLPREGGYLRLRVLKEGYEADERAVSGVGGRTLRIRLRTREETPPGMVWTPPFASAGMNLNMRFQLRAARIPGAWLDKYEVSNRQFKEFVDAGGYQKREYWKPPFWKDGKRLSWEQAIAEFRDATGRPGPSTLGSRKLPGWQA